MPEDYNSKQEKLRLLQQLENMGYHSDGRKVRSDKGKPQGAKPRNSKASKLSIYMRVKARMFNRDTYLQANDTYGTMLEIDENSFYIVIPARYKNSDTPYIQVHDGRRIEHTVRRVRTQKEIDLEKYRFEAYQEQAILNPTNIVPSEYWPELRQMLNIRYGFTGNEATEALTHRQINWFQLFVEFYFLQPKQFAQWTYERWRKHYSNIPVQQLPEDFEFDYYNAPGTEFFHPEWAWKAKEREQQELESQQQEQKRKREQFLQNMSKRWNK